MHALSTTTANGAPRKLLTAGAFFVLFLSAPTTANALTCKSWGFVGQANAQTEALAKVQARLNWAAKVTAHWNLNWANWNLASSRWEICEPYRRQTRCIANGIPCKR